jgi:hypothetical protein
MSELFLAVRCATCDTPTPSDPPPLTWSPAVENGNRVWICAECARVHIRSIESKLDPAWW